MILNFAKYSLKPTMWVPHVYVVFSKKISLLAQTVLKWQPSKVKSFSESRISEDSVSILYNIHFKTEESSRLGLAPFFLLSKFFSDLTIFFKCNSVNWDIKNEVKTRFGKIRVQNKFCISISIRLTIIFKWIEL